MKQINHEATAREVLAEVNLLDVGVILKNNLAILVGYFVFFGVASLLGAGASAAFGPSKWGIPSWVLWFVLIWMFVGIYTSEKSYHEHKLALYFPKTGWLGSLAIAAYAMMGFALYHSGGSDPDAEMRIIKAVLWFAWAFPPFLALSLLEVGHNRLMEKRAAGLER